MKRRLVSWPPVSLLDVTLWCRTVRCGTKIIGLIAHAIDEYASGRRVLIRRYTLLVAEGFAGFPGDCSPSGGPS
jgi:hypothetical protein